MRNPEDYKKQIAKLAYRFYPLFCKARENMGEKDMADLLQDGYEVFARLCNEEQEKPLNCPFGLALTLQLKEKWINERATQRAQKRGAKVEFIHIDQVLDIDKNQLITSAIAFNPIERIDAYFDLSDEMKIVVQLLQDTPAELALLSRTFGIQDAIGKYLKKFKGWKPKQIQRLKGELSLIKKQMSHEWAQNLNL